VTAYADWLATSNVPKLFLKAEPGGILAGGAVLGAALGATLGNQYAQAHKPGCVNVPAGPPCRHLDPDNSSSYQAAAIGLGTGLGVLVGVLLSR